jgi:hypothetical protein
MIEIMRELGIAKRNQLLAQQFIEHHRRAFGANYRTNPRAAEYHRREYIFWTEQLAMTEQHIEQQHRYLRACC